MSLSASFCVSARVSVSLCVFPRLSVCLSASLCVVFPRIHARLHVSLRCLSASLRVFPRPSASSPRVSQDIPASLCVCPRVYASSFRVPLRRLSASPYIFAFSLCLSASLCVALPRLCASFRVCLRRSSFRISLRLSCSLRRFLSLSTSFRVSPRRLSASLCSVPLFFTSSIYVSLRLSVPHCVITVRLSASFGVSLDRLSTSPSLLCPSCSHFCSIFVAFCYNFDIFWVPSADFLRLSTSP